MNTHTWFIYQFRTYFYTILYLFSHLIYVCVKYIIIAYEYYIYYLWAVHYYVYFLYEKFEFVNVSDNFY